MTDKTDDYTYITCPICNKRFITLVSHIINIHKLSIPEFKKLYPNSPILSKKRLDQAYKSAIEKGLGKSNKNKKWTDEQKANASENRKGEKNGFYGKKHSNETKIKMSENHADFTGDKNPLIIWLNKDENNKNEYKQCLIQAWDDRKKDKEYWEKLCKRRSDTTSKLMMEGKLEPYGKNHKHGYFKSEKQNIEIYYRSSYEEQFLQFCEDNLEKYNIVFTAANIRIPYKDYKNNDRYYIPDFIINDNILIEIKPKSLLYYSNNQLKIEALKTYCLTNNLKSIIITEKELENLVKVFEDIL